MEELLKSRCQFRSNTCAKVGILIGYLLNLVSKAESVKSTGMAESVLPPERILLLGKSLQILVLHFMVKRCLSHGCYRPSGESKPQSSRLCSLL